MIFFLFLIRVPKDKAGMYQWVIKLSKTFHSGKIESIHVNSSREIFKKFKWTPFYEGPEVVQNLTAKSFFQTTSFLSF